MIKKNLLGALASTGMLLVQPAYAEISQTSSYSALEPYQIASMEKPDSFSDIPIVSSEYVRPKPDIEEIRKRDRINRLNEFKDSLWDVCRYTNYLSEDESLDEILGNSLEDCTVGFDMGIGSYDFREKVYSRYNLNGFYRRSNEDVTIKNVGITTFTGRENSRLEGMDMLVFEYRVGNMNHRVLGFNASANGRGNIDYTTIFHASYNTFHDNLDEVRFRLPMGQDIASYLTFQIALKDPDGILMSSDSYQNRVVKTAMYNAVYTNYKDRKMDDEMLYAVEEVFAQNCEEDGNICVVDLEGVDYYDMELKRDQGVSVLSYTPVFEDTHPNEFLFNTSGVLVDCRIGGEKQSLSECTLDFDAYNDITFEILDKYLKR